MIQFIYAGDVRSFVNTGEAEYSFKVDGRLRFEGKVSFSTMSCIYRIRIEAIPKSRVEIEMDSRSMALLKVEASGVMENEIRMRASSYFQRLGKGVKAR